MHIHLDNPAVGASALLVGLLPAGAVRGAGPAAVAAPRWPRPAASEACTPALAEDARCSLHDARF